MVELSRIVGNSDLAVRGFNNGNFRRWRRALARVEAGAGNALLAFCGDSNMIGSLLTPALNAVGNVPSTVGRFLQREDWPVRGDYWTRSLVERHGAENVGVTQGAGWVGYQSQVFSNTTTTDALEFVAQGENTTTFDIWYFANNSGQFTRSVDGGSPVNVSFTNTGTVNKITVSGTERISISRVSGNIWIVGVRAYSSTNNSVTIANLAISGSATNLWTATSGEQFSPGRQAVRLQPDLAIINLGINDVNNGVVLSSYVANMTDLITALKVNSDVLLVQFQDLGGSSENVAQARQAAFQAAMNSLSVDLDVPVISLRDRWGLYSDANALGIMADSLHPNRTGYSDTARYVAEAILRQ